MALYGAVNGNRNERSGGAELNGVALAGVNAGAGGTMVRDRLRRVPSAALHMPREGTPNRFGSLSPSLLCPTMARTRNLRITSQSFSSRR